jgi:hypothetical protein
MDKTVYDRAAHWIKAHPNKSDRGWLWTLKLFAPDLVDKLCHTSDDLGATDRKLDRSQRAYWKIFDAFDSQSRTLADQRIKLENALADQRIELENTRSQLTNRHECVTAYERRMHHAEKLVAEIGRKADANGKGPMDSKGVPWRPANVNAAPSPDLPPHSCVWADIHPPVKGKGYFDL